MNSKENQQELLTTQAVNEDLLQQVDALKGQLHDKNNKIDELK